MLLHSELIEALDRHIATHPITATAFGRQVARDPRLVFDIRRGRNLGLKLAAKIMDTIREQQAESQAAAE